MKKVMIVGLIGISLFSLVGCNESSKEVIIEEGHNRKEIVLEKINNEKNENYYFESYLNDEYYLCKEIREEEKVDEETVKTVYKYEENLYKLNKDNEFEKTNKKVLNSRYRKDGIDVRENEKDSPIRKVRYIKNDTGEEKVGDFNFGDEIISYMDLIYGKEKIAYIIQKDIQNKNILKIADIEENTIKKVDYDFEGEIRSVIYADSYYVLEDKSFKLYKLKEEKDSFKVEEAIDLMEEFNIRTHGKEFYVGRIFVKENGEVYLEGNDVNHGKQHTDSCGQALFRYNLKTKEKGRIDYKLTQDLVISDYNLKSGYIMLESIKDFDTETANEKAYIGKVSNDKVEIIEEIDIKSDGAFIRGIETMFNEDGTGALISYVRVKDNQRLNEYVKVTIK